MELRTVVVGEYGVNCYLAWDAETNTGFVVDPGAEAERIVKETSRAGFEPSAILLTHGHVDHIGAVWELKERFPVPLYAGRDEVPMLVDANLNMSVHMGQPITTPSPDVLLEDEQTFSIGPTQLRALATPGHSPGGICLLVENEGVLFCGDCLFAGSIGRTDLPGCSTGQLMNSIEKKILTLPDNIICYPGHGPSTTVGAEKVNNPFLQGDYFA